jgi:hypothetical protein
MEEDKLRDLREHQFGKDAEKDELNKIINIKKKNGTSRKFNYCIVNRIKNNR